MLQLRVLLIVCPRTAEFRFVQLFWNVSPQDVGVPANQRGIVGHNKRMFNG